MNNIALMYHDIINSDPSESGFQNASALKYKVKVDVFEKQVAAIARYQKKMGLPSSYVEFTFDDGGVSFYNFAAPILEKNGFRGKFYISTSYIGSPGFLNENQIKDLEARGHTIGSHSHTHPERMNYLSDLLVFKEWSESQDILKRILDKSSISASIPNGFSSKMVLRTMNSLGITEIYTSEPTTYYRSFSDSIVKGRFVVIDTDTVDSVMRIVSSRMCRLRQNMRYKFLNMAKAILGDSYLKLRNYMIK